jgi:hypothetical protein
VPSHRGRNWPRCWLTIAGLIFLFTSGCQHFGPKSIVADRVPYNEAVASSWKEQMLLNIVRLRYADTMSFEDVSQIVSGYSLNRSVGMDVGLVPGAIPGIASSDRIRSLFRFNAGFSERPTVTYSPKSGSQFTRQLAAPLRSELVLFMMEAGYPADNIFDLTVQSINGLNNRTVTGGKFQPADAEFTWLLGILRRAQLSRSVSSRVKLAKDQGDTYLLGLRSFEPDSKLEEDLRRAKQLLGLDENEFEFRVIDGTIPGNSKEIAIQTRPVMLVLRDLVPFIEVPDEHLADGSAVPIDVVGTSEDWPLMIQCSDQQPCDTFTSVEYRGYWFWVDDRHLASKRTFNYLMFLSAQADRKPDERLPMVTIQAN